MRVGPWVFAAGLSLLCAGVVSTRADAWDTRVPATTIPLSLTGIDTLDMRDSHVRKVVISSKDPPQLHYPGGQAYQWRDEQAPAAPPTCRATGSVLRCASGERYLPGEPVLHVPPGRYRLLLRDASVLAKSDIESLALEVNGRVDWTGPAGALDVVVAMPRQRKGMEQCGMPHFTFEGGRVHDLRIRASAGGLAFNNLSDVGGIEVQAARDVGLTLDKASDIARIKVVPLASTPAVDTRGACADAMRARAMAAMD